MKPAICTQCGGQIEVDETKEAGVCKHCGTAFITEKVINNYTTNYTTVHNVTENVTKIIYGNEKDEADDFYKRGLTHLKLEEWYKAQTNFEKAISLSPEKTIYYFYAAVAASKNFTDFLSIYEKSLGVHSCIVQDKNLLKFFKFATAEEKERVSKEYGFDFSSEKDFTVSVVKRLITIENNDRVDYLLKLILAKTNEISAEKMAIIIYDYISDGDKTGDRYRSLLDWAFKRLPEEKTSSLKNITKNGTFIISNVDALPSNDGVFSITSPTVTRIELAFPGIADKMKAKFKKFFVTKNIKSVQINTFEVIEFEEGYDENNISAIAYRAEKAVILPDSVTKVSFRFAKPGYPFIYSKKAIENTAYRSDTNEFLSGKYSHSYYYSSGIIMGKAVFYPMVSESTNMYAKKYKWSKTPPKDYQENADKFIENVKAVFGENFLKDKKVLAIPPEKQYKKALKINKK